MNWTPKWWPTRPFLVWVHPGRCKKFFSWIQFVLLRDVYRIDGRVPWELHHLHCYFTTAGFLCVYLVLFLAWWEMRVFFGVGFMVWGSLLLLWSMCDLIYKSLLRSIIFFLQLSVVFLWKSLNMHYLFQLLLNHLILLRDVIDINVTIEVWNLSGWFSSMCSAVSKKIKLLFMFI